MSQLAKYLKYLMSEMDLGPWSIDIDEHHAADDAYAEIRCTFGQRRATLRLDPGLLRQERQVIRWVLVHELMHIHNNPLAEAVAGLEPALGVAAHSTFQNHFKTELERANDAIATAFARHLDLPPFGKDA